MPKQKKRISRSSIAGTGVSIAQDVNVRETVIMFVDVVGASEVSNHIGVREYKHFVQQFKDIFTRACKAYLTSWLDDLEEDADYHYSARGDEGILLLYPKINSYEPSLLIDIAINIALELKRSWLISERNISNVQSGIVPIELAVGIHVGQTYVAEEREREKRVARPEGYAINLAKRVESFSRTGQYTHIFVSEAAHGLLNRLADEKTYLFDEPKSLTAKGFSREIRTFEIMHHYLPTDWTKDVEDPAVHSSKALLRVPLKGDIEIYMAAYKLNPTNIWLAEECIRGSMLFRFNELTKIDREKADKLREAYSDAMDITKYLAQGDQRDPGILMIKGLIHGESYDFELERACYVQAREFKRQVSVLDWYEGYSLSSEVWYEIGGEDLSIDEIRKLTRDTIKPRRGSKLSADCIRSKITVATQLLARAADAARWQAWIHYTYGCELVMWGNADDREKGISEIKYACDLLKDVKEDVPDEPYLVKIQNDPKIMTLIQ